MPSAEAAAVAAVDAKRDLSANSVADRRAWTHYSVSTRFHLKSDLVAPFQMKDLVVAIVALVRDVIDATVDVEA